MKRVMKKPGLFLLLFLPLCSSCLATTRDLERKKVAGDSTVLIYQYDWEKVYDATMFVWRHSEDWYISTRYTSLDIDSAREEKAIWVKIPIHASMDMGIFFEPQGESKTKVTFVKGSFTGMADRETAINRLIDETHFYLENGEEAYRKYTHQEHIKQQKEFKAE